MMKASHHHQYEVFLTKNMKLFVGTHHQNLKAGKDQDIEHGSHVLIAFCPILYSRGQGTKIFHFQNFMKKC